MRIGVISDTHIGDARVRVPVAAMRAFAGAECILHAGDILIQDVLDALASVAPVHAVSGNCDPSDLAWRLPDRLVLQLGGLHIGLTHGHLGRGTSTPSRALSAFAGAAEAMDVVVFGHSHEPFNQVQGRTLLFNPGSATQRRRQPYPSYGLLEIEEDRCRAEVIYLR